MGYRLYLAKIPKKEYEEITSMSYEEYISKYGDEGIWKVITHLSEVCDIDTSNCTEVVFKDEKLNNMFCETCFHTLNKSLEEGEDVLLYYGY